MGLSQEDIRPNVRGDRMRSNEDDRIDYDALDISDYDPYYDDPQAEEDRW